MDQYLEIYTPVAQLANRLDIGNKGRLTLDLATELVPFRQMLRDIDIPAGEISSLGLEGSVGDYRLVFNDQPVDIARGVEDIRYNANLLNFLRRLGLSITATAQAKETEIKDQYIQKARGFHELMRMKRRIQIAKDIVDRYGKSPRNEQELIQILTQDPNLEASFSNFIEKVKGSYVVDPNATPYGEWVRKPYRSRNYTLTSLFRIINNHKKSLGGCWAVRADGYKCLLRSLSCDPIKGQRPYKCQPDNRCGPDGQQPCYSCLKWNPDNTCAEVPPCEDRKDSCSVACSNREIEVPSDTVLICLKRKFWISAQDFMNENFTITQGPVVTPPTPGVDDAEDEDAHERIEDEDVQDNIPQRPLSDTLISFFKSTWVIWAIGVIIITIIVYKNSKR